MTTTAISPEGWGAIVEITKILGPALIVGSFTAWVTHHKSSESRRAEVLAENRRLSSVAVEVFGELEAFRNAANNNALKSIEALIAYQNPNASPPKPVQLVVSCARIKALMLANFPESRAIISIYHTAQERFRGVIEDEIRSIPKGHLKDFGKRALEINVIGQTTMVETTIKFCNDLDSFLTEELTKLGEHDSS